MSRHDLITGRFSDTSKRSTRPSVFGVQFDVLRGPVRRQHVQLCRSRADVDTRDSVRPVQPQIAHAEVTPSTCSVAASVWTPLGPMGHSELSMSMACLARTPCGVLMLIRHAKVASAAGGGEALRTAAGQRGYERERRRLQVAPRAAKPARLARQRPAQPRTRVEMRPWRRDWSAAPCAPRWPGPSPTPGMPRRTPTG